MGRRRMGAIALVAGLALVGASCGNDDDDTSDTTIGLGTTIGLDTTIAADTTPLTDTTPADTTPPTETLVPDTGATGDTTATASGDANTVQIAAREPEAGRYVFEGMPETLPAGAVTFQLNNAGGEPHEMGMVQIEGDHSIDEFLAQVVEAEGTPIPDWVQGHTGVGFTAPTASTTATVELRPGTYLFYCPITDQNNVAHAKNGMAGTLTISGQTPATLPEAPARITMKDFSFEQEGVTAGTNTIRLENTGNEYHHVQMFPLVEGATLEQVKAALTGPPPGADPSAPTSTAEGGLAAPGAGGVVTSTTAAGAAPDPSAGAPGGAAGGPPPFNPEGVIGTTVMGPGEASVTTLDLPAGRYAFACFITDKAGGAPHIISHDMIQEFTIA